jgi:xylosylprotein 4-beta-galactosyltransferase
MTRDLFRQVNGLSNRYWGWGLEDDEFYARLRESGVQIERPINITTGRQNTFKHYHHPKVRMVF